MVSKLFLLNNQYWQSEHLELQKEHRKKVKELDIIQKTSPEEMWLTELTTLEEEYLLFKEEKERMHDTMPTVPKKKTKKVVPKLME